LKAADHGGPFLMIAHMSVYSAIYGKDDIRNLPPPAKAKKQDRWQGRSKKDRRKAPPEGTSVFAHCLLAPFKNYHGTGGRSAAFDMQTKTLGVVG
jgi:hypothetical protein